LYAETEEIDGKYPSEQALFKQETGYNAGVIILNQQVGS
jgi:hypothetical protein